jgi:general secretion pathway protein H
VRGFTLLELLVVMLILALVAAAAAPALTGSLAATQERAAAQDLATVLRQTRGAAIAGNRDLALAIDTEAHSYAVDGGRVRPLPDSVTISLFIAQTEQLGRTGGRIRFFPDGSSTGGEVTLAAASRRSVIRVDWLTGRVDVSEVDDARR